MKQISILKTISACAALLIGSNAFSQEIIYQQDFDGNNGTFTNTIVSQTTPINGWLASSTAVQYGNTYRHLWNFSDVTSGANPIVMPISGRSLGMGFYNGNTPLQQNQFFYTYAGEPTDNPPFFTSRWAHVGISTVGYENITVEFKWRCTGEEFQGKIYDYGTVNTSIDGGATWAMDQSAGKGGVTSEHGSFNKGLYYGNEDVQTAVLTLPANRADQANFRLAFRMVADEGYGTGGGFIIDDIVVKGTKIPTAGTSNVNLSKTTIYKEGGDFVIKANASTISQVELYDMSGKLVNLIKTNDKEVKVNADTLKNGVYVVKSTLANGETITQKIKN